MKTDLLDTTTVSALRAGKFTANVENIKRALESKTGSYILCVLSRESEAEHLRSSLEKVGVEMRRVMFQVIGTPANSEYIKKFHEEFEKWKRECDVS
jgi:PleD family two-component response regulator